VVAGAVLVVMSVGACGDDGRTLRPAGGVPTGSGELVSTTTAPEPGVVTTPDPEADKAAALAAWEAYKTAILATDGPAASKVVSEGTFASYQVTLDRALTMERAMLEAEDVMDILMVLAVRAQLSLSQIDGLNGRQFFELGVDHGLINETTVRDISFDGAEITGDQARLTTSNATQTTRGMPMLREAGGWKVDLGGYTASLGEQFDRAAAAQGKSRLDFAIEMLGIGPGSEEAERLLKPMKG